MLLRAGTSGWSYPAWCGPFYPAGTPRTALLAAYAARLPAVEVNASSYRLPSPSVLTGWRGQVPPAFRFALKAPRWFAQGSGAPPERALTALRAAADALGPTLGAVLVQLLPGAAPDLGRLADLLGRLALPAPVAVEAKDPAWLGEPLYRTLAAAGATLCVTDSEAQETPLVPTAGLGYLRLRRAAYAGAELAAWAARIAAQPWSAAYVFFRHEDTAAGPRLAAALLEAAAQVAAGAAAPPAGP